MNVHSPDGAATLDSLSHAQADKRALILDAAKSCFARAGFHRTTMQDIAAEAGMSPGNLYRYFASKDAVTEGLADRDRMELADDFAQVEGDDDLMAAFAALGRKYFQEEPRDRAVLCLEIWAEATRNEAFAAIRNGIQSELIARMTRLFAQGQARGLVRAKADPRDLALIVATLSDGLFVRRATAHDFDPEREVGNVLRVIGAMLGGAVPFDASEGETP